jgi:hypothetical protein
MKGSGFGVQDQEISASAVAQRFCMETLTPDR